MRTQYLVDKNFEFPPTARWSKNKKPPRSAAQQQAKARYEKRTESEEDAKIASLPQPTSSQLVQTILPLKEEPASRPPVVSPITAAPQTSLVSNQLGAANPTPPEQVVSSQRSQQREISSRTPPPYSIFACCSAPQQ